MIVDIPNLPTPPQKEGGIVRYLAELTTCLYEYLSHLATFLSGQIEADNLASYSYATADSGSADAEITITHGLGRIPTHYIWNIDKAGTVYDSQRVNWTTNIMYVKCSAANVKLNILVIK